MAPGLAVAAVVGVLLGACGGGDGSAQTTRTATRPGVTATRPAVTAEPTVPTRTAPTLPARTETSPAAPAETTTIETTTNETTTVETAPPSPPPVITIETRTTTIAAPPPPAATVETQTTTVVPIPAETAVAAEPTSSTDSSGWGWIGLALGLVIAAVIGLLIWRQHRGRAASWSAHLEQLSRRTLIALDEVLAEGSIVAGRIESLAREARALEAEAPDARSRAAAARVRARLDELAATLETDRALRLGSPPPSTEQLSYSTALIRRQAEQLQGVLRTHGPEDVS